MQIAHLTEETQKQIIEAQTIQSKILDLPESFNKLLKQCYKCFGDAVTPETTPYDACCMINHCKDLVQILRTTFNVLVLELRKYYAKSFDRYALGDSAPYAVQAEVELRTTYKDFDINICTYSDVFGNLLYEHIYLHMLVVKKMCKIFNEVS